MSFKQQQDAILCLWRKYFEAILRLYYKFIYWNKIYKNFNDAG